MRKSRSWGAPAGRSHCDLASFFDTVEHQKLMNRLRERLTDQRLLSLIAKYLKAGLVLPEKDGGGYEDTEEGVPQGGPL